MAKDKGNEKVVIKYLFDNKSNIELDHLKKISKLEIPYKDKLEDISIKYNPDDFANDDSHKKADLYINGTGISIKQSGGSVLYNKWQRKNVTDLLKDIFNDDKLANAVLSKLDNKVQELNNKKIKRDVNAEDIMTDNELKEFLRFVMLNGSANIGTTKFPAKYILTAPKIIKTNKEIKVYTFDEFFLKYKKDIVFALRRCWYGQESDSEHNRAKTIKEDLLNKPWVFENLAGSPRAHNETKKKWRDEIQPSDRREVYYININSTK